MQSPSKAPFEWLARLGYGARGLVYCLVGGLAVLAAVGAGGQTGGSRSALATLLDQPFGKALLGMISLGLAGFAAWRTVEGVTDADHRGSSRSSLGVRAAHIGSGAIYAGLAIFALNLALGRSSGSGSEDRAARDWTAWLLSQPFGQWLVGAIGLGVIGAGVGFVLKGWRGQVTAYLTCGAATRRWAVPLGRVGFAARGVVFVLVGGFLVLAALHSNSREVKGLGSALESLRQHPYGWLLLAVTAAGLFAFGLFGFVQARYRRIHPPGLEEATRSVRAQVRSTTT
jgi:hypothetical protein